MLVNHFTEVNANQICFDKPAYVGPLLVESLVIVQHVHL